MNSEFINKRLAEISIIAGQTKIIAVRPAKDDEVQLVFAEKLEIGSNRSGLADFMEGHEAFSGSNGVQPYWQTATLKGVANLFGEDVLNASKKAIETGDYVPLNITNPKFASGTRMRMQVTETHTASDWDIENLDRAAKSDGRGNYMSAGGFAIFRRIEIVKGEPQHRLIEHDSVVTDPFDLEYLEREELGSAQEPDTKAKEAQDQKKDLTGQETQPEAKKSEETVDEPTATA